MDRSTRHSARQWVIGAGDRTTWRGGDQGDKDVSSPEPGAEQWDGVAKAERDGEEQRVRGPVTGKGGARSKMGQAHRGS
jgi:hypothetical protein